MNLVRSACLAVALSVSSGSVATAQDFDKGQAAYEEGDYATALQEWRPLAEQGDAAARYGLGMMYLLGNEVGKDELEGLQLLRLSAEQGHGRAQGQLGYMYYSGRTVTEDRFKGLEWYRLSAEHGDALSQHTLGLIAQTEENYIDSVKWNRLAAEQGRASSQLTLAINYYKGNGVPQDFIQAYMWFNISSELGDSLSSLFLNQISGKMTPADISQAQAMARAQECGVVYPQVS